ncbi:MAG: hypothetical protein HYZ57_07525 [Acidobacteria bacterium]|nr:hypothetical protein [Acidobacteriota bacterium]
MLLTATLRLIWFSLGAGLHFFAGLLLLRKRRVGVVEHLALATLFAVALWQAASAAALLHDAIIGDPESLLYRAAGQAARVGLALAPSLLLHLLATLAALPSRLAVLWYAPAVFAAWALGRGHPAAAGVVLALSLGGGAVLALAAARERADAVHRRFLRLLAGALALVLLGSLAGAESATVVFASLAPITCFLWFVYRYNFLGLLIGPRVIFAVSAGVMTALYLFAIRLLANLAERRFEAFGPLLEMALVLAAAGVWLPLYGWMTRFISKRTQLYADFSKRLSQEAVGILELPKRLQYIAEEVGKAFAIRRVLILVCDPGPARDTRPREQSPGLESGNMPANRLAAGDRPLQAGFSADPAPPLVPDLRPLEAAVRDLRPDLVQLERTRDDRLRSLLAASGFNYLFPLWYENHLSGLLLADTSPRLYLDEYEPILLGLSRQISHLIETGRLIEEKISLEMTLMKQEHLATLGSVAATIAHEVKNPLSSIKTLAQLLREDPSVDGRYGRDLTFIIAETDRLNACVQQLLTFSRPAPEADAGLSVSEELENIARTFSYEHSPHRVRIEPAIQPGLRVTGADRQSLQQIVLNLMHNAIQASPTGGKVRIEARSEPDTVRVSVSDEGPGIPPDLQTRIFEPFFTTRQKGTGLGLAIVRKNVRQLGGDIHIDSPVFDGRGTRVTVTLPLKT